jgi:diguanylate cyclase (GGDEF)-like protein
MAAAETWLVSSELDRERLLDIDRRMKPVRARTLGLLGLTVLACAPWIGLWAPLAFAGGVAGIAVLDRDLPQRVRPEYWIGAAWALAQLVIAAGVALTGGPHSTVIGWLAIPLVTLAARFNRRGLWAGWGFTVVLLLATTIGVDPAATLRAPQLVLVPLALVSAIAMLSTVGMRSDLEHRSGAIIDPLTGLLNRSILPLRFEELAHQAQLTGQPIGLIVADLDHFKSVNDEHGHVRGDAALRDTAYALRKALRSFDLTYRVGGEEFVMLLPGLDLEHTRVVAERLRQVISAARPAGLELTISLGVSAAAGAAMTPFERMFESADRALYEAKQRGRDRVCVAEPSQPHSRGAPPAWPRLGQDDEPVGAATFVPSTPPAP